MLLNAAPRFSRKLFLPLLLSILFFSCTKDSTTTEVSGNWIRRSEFEGVGRTEAVSFSIGTKIYVGGGYDGTTRLQDFWSLDENSGTWLRIADFPGVARNSAVAFAVGTKGYVGTGYDENDNKLKDFWEYDPATNTWTQKADFAGTARYGALGFSLSGKGYITTGYDGNYLKDLWQYDPVTNTWAQKASLAGSKRSDATVFVYNNMAYVLAGLNNGTYLNDFWVYDAGTDAWTEKRKISSVSDASFDDDYGDYIRRSNASAFVMNDKAYLTCGSRSGIIGSTWEYNIAEDTWTEKTSFEGSAREGAIGFSINNKGYIVTGANGSYRFDDLWEFKPSDTQSSDDN
jgi:N-acetylneuraminic acid mutarotase